MRRRQLQDSQGTFETCVILMLVIMAVMTLFSLAADAIDKAFDNDAAALDRQLSHTQRAEIIGRLQ